MKLQFDRKVCHCLKTVVRDAREQEQTQEVRLQEGLPDVGSILSAWGQTILRSKEWRDGSIGATGGVLVWVLYAPEDGSAPQALDTWVPFQFKWDFPEADREGAIRTEFALTGLDARIISARKIMVRANVTAMGEAFVPEDVEICLPAEAPQGVELLKRSYPMFLPVEAGEKTMTVEEELTLPSSCPAVEKIIRFDAQPVILDEKIMAGKLVFRGATNLHLLYRSQEGGVQSWDFELPFSQFTELDQEYGQDASSDIILQSTGLELEHGEDGILNVKCGLVAQYRICCREEVSLIADAYSLTREMTARMEELEIQPILDCRVETLHGEKNIPVDGNRIVDVSCRTALPWQVRQGNQLTVEGSGQFQLLYYDNAGVLQAAEETWQQQMKLPADETTRVAVDCLAVGRPQVSLSSGNALVRNDLTLKVLTTTGRSFPMVQGLELGEPREPDPNRPSLILRRAGGEELWDIAKSTGSTMDAIRQANKLREEPEEGQLLLIPIC